MRGEDPESQPHGAGGSERRGTIGRAADAGSPGPRVRDNAVVTETRVRGLFGRRNHQVAGGGFAV